MRGWTVICALFLIGQWSTSSSAACVFNCVPSESEAQRLAKTHFGRTPAPTATIEKEFGIGLRSNMALVVQQRQKIEGVLRGQGQCELHIFSCPTLQAMARHRLIDAVDWSTCSQNPEGYCAIAVFSKHAMEAVEKYKVGSRGTSITVKTAELRFVRIVRTRGDGNHAEVHYEFEIIPTLFGTTIATIRAERVESGFVAVKYSDGWHLAN